MGASKKVVLLLLAIAVAACSAPAETAVDAPIGTEIGNRAPRLHGALPSGEPLTFDLGSGMPTVVTFLRSVDCGLCRHQLRQMSENRTGYTQLGVRLVAVSLDPPEHNRAFEDNGELGFDLLSVEPAVFREWGILDPESGTPLPATFIVDEQGVVRHRHIGRNAGDRMRDAEVLTLLGSIIR